MQKHEFPKVVYHKSKGPVTVYSEDNLKELGAGWKESPADHGVITAPSADQMKKQSDSNDFSQQMHERRDPNHLQDNAWGEPIVNNDDETESEKTLEHTKTSLGKKDTQNIAQVRTEKAKK